MFNRKNTNGKVLLFVILLFMCGLFSANASEEEWDWGDDITASGFSWGYITPDYPMYYVDSSNYVRKKIVKAYVVEDHYYDSTHCYTTASHGIPHVHFEYELGNGGLPSKSQVNTYWDARFIHLILHRLNKIVMPLPLILHLMVRMNIGLIMKVQYLLMMLIQ